MDSLFSRQRIPNVEKALFDLPILLQYDVKAKYRLISGKFSGMKYFHPSFPFNQPEATLFWTLSINQSNCSIAVRLLLLFCSRVFISRSYENRSIYLSNAYDFQLELWHILLSKKPF